MFLLQNGFELSSETPYYFLQKFIDLTLFPINFVHAVVSYLDFAITVKSLIIYPTPTLFEGCVLASYQTMKETPMELGPLVQSLKNSNPPANDFCEQILQKID